MSIWNYLLPASTDPRVNLAIEEVIFNDCPRDQSYCMLWQNEPSVIVGKYQNTAAEVDTAYASKSGIHVVRRLSGGGAVYHDLGNLNFTLITDAGDSSQLDFQLFCMPVVETLREFYAEAQIRGRNDIVIGGRKFSGNAEYVREGRVMHHGTILFDTDETVMTRVLTVDPEKIQSKGIPSVRSRVTNVKEHLPAVVGLTEFKNRLLSHMVPEDAVPYELTKEQQARVHTLAKERYGSWDWNYGSSPPCNLSLKQRLEGCGALELRLQVEEGRIQSAELLGDFFAMEDPAVLCNALVGCRMEEKELCGRVQSMEPERVIRGLTREGLMRLILS